MSRTCLSRKRCWCDAPSDLIRFLLPARVKGVTQVPKARPVAATSPRHSVGTTKELSSTFSSSLIRCG